jgi:hypothetical protein
MQLNLELINTMEVDMELYVCTNGIEYKGSYGSYLALQQNRTVCISGPTRKLLLKQQWKRNLSFNGIDPGARKKRSLNLQCNCICRSHEHDCTWNKHESTTELPLELPRNFSHGYHGIVSETIPEAKWNCNDSYHETAIGTL